MEEVSAAEPVTAPTAPGRSTLSSRQGRRLLSESDPTRVGRYAVLRKLGSGGMGVVYSARDAQLNRLVAIKLLRPDIESHALDQRMRREAQALARLSHPNVVQVYEVGEHDGRVFIAMEFVPGETLAAWQQRHRGAEHRARLIDMYLKAGRGLQAAHEHGLVHRDFKPENVLIREPSGVPRVVDFGLARAHGESVAGDAEDPARRATAHDAGAANILHLPLTRAGSVMGTPAYMAPEQHEGHAVDARSDQYSLCVSLYEALTGSMPGLDARQQLRKRVSARLARALCRGLAADPSARWPDLSALLLELERELAPSRLRPALALVALTSAGAIAVINLGADERCTTAKATEHWRGLWDAEQRASLSRGYAALELGYADATWTLAARRLDDYVRGWSRVYVDACQAHDDGELSPRRLDLAMSCLQRRRGDAAAMLSVLGTPSGALAERAVDMIASLAPVSRCASVHELDAQVRVEPPRDEHQRAEVDRVRGDIARAASLDVAGRPREALEVAAEAVGEARALDYPPLLAEALYQRGDVEAGLADGPAAERTLFEALDLAEAHRHDGLKADVWLQLSRLAIEDGADVDRGHRWLGHVRAVIARLGDDPARRAAALWSEAQLFYTEKKYDRARASASSALTVATDARDTPVVARADVLHLLGNIATERGRITEALELYDRALARGLERYGPDHPKLSRLLFNIGLTLVEHGEPDRAGSYLQRALDAETRTFGQRGLPVATIHMGMAQRYEQTGALEQAEAHARAACEIFEAHPDRRQHEHAAAINLVAALDFRRRRYARALDGYQRALALWSAVLPDGDIDLAIARYNIAETHLAVGDVDAAEAEFKRACERFASELDAQHPLQAYCHKGLGLVHLARERREDAAPALSRALELLPATPGYASERAELLWGLARAEPDRARARQLADDARSLYRAQGPWFAWRVEQISTWLDGQQR